jgi:hypothetical protein
MKAIYSVFNEMKDLFDYRNNTEIFRKKLIEFDGTYNLVEFDKLYNVASNILEVLGEFVNQITIAYHQEQIHILGFTFIYFIISTLLTFGLGWFFLFRYLEK